jgi:hypothetical protein
VANRHDSPVRRGGHATSLAPATKVIMTELYGTYLWWLKTSGYLDPQSGPETQMTADSHAEFCRRAAQTGFGQYDLQQFAHAGDDDEVSRPQARLEMDMAEQRDAAPLGGSSGTSTASQPSRWTAHPSYHRGFGTDVRNPLDQLPAERVRDCVLIALTVTSGLRLRNLVSMRLDRNLIRQNNGWEVLFDATEVKNEEAILSQVPALLNPFMDRYLDVDRVRLPRRCKCPTDAVRLSRKGGPLGPNRIALAFKRIGEEMLGYPINTAYVTSWQRGSSTMILRT